MSRIDIDLHAAKLIAHQNRTQVAASTSGLLKNLKNDLATGALRFATTKLGKDLGYQHPNIDDIAEKAVTDFIKIVDNATSHKNPTGLLGTIVDRRKFDYFEAGKRQPKLAEVENDDAVERLSIIQPEIPFCLTVTSQVLDAVEDGRIKGRHADGIFMMLEDETNLDSADRQACKRAREKLGDVFGEESSMWG